MTSREQQKQETREKILNTTVSMLLDPEFTSLNTNQLAKEAGVSKGSIFHHFSSKNQLILDAFEKILMQQFDKLSIGDNIELLDPADLLREIIRENIQLLIGHQNMTSLLFKIMMEIGEDKESSEVAQLVDEFQEVTTLLNPVFTRLGWKERDSQLVARLFVSLLDGMALQFQLTGDIPPSGEDYWERMIELIVRLFDKR